MELTQDVDTWRKMAVPGLPGVFAEFRILSGQEYRDLNTNTPRLLGDDELEDRLCNAIRAIEGLEHEGKPVTDMRDVLQHAPARITSHFLQSLYLSQYTEDDAGN